MNGLRRGQPSDFSIVTAQTLRLATVEALLDVQSGVGDLNGAIEVLAEGASVASDHSVDAAVSAANAVREPVAVRDLRRQQAVERMRRRAWALPDGCTFDRNAAKER